MRSGVGVAVASVAAEDVSRLSDSELATSIEEERGWIDALEADCARRLAVFTERRAYLSSGAPDAVAWLKEVGRMSGGAAADRVRVAEKLDQLPTMSSALRQGDISFGQAAVIARAAEDVGAEAASKLAELAIAAAARLGPGELRQYTDRLQCELNREAFEKDRRKAFERRRCDIGQAPDGMFDLDGRFSADDGALIHRAIDALVGEPAADDQRTPRQRRADAVAEMARRALAGGGDLGLGGERAQLVVVAPLSTLRREAGAPPGEIDWQFPVPAETLRRLSCDSTLVPAVVDDHGDPLHLGRAVRTMPPAVRRALALKYKGCGFPSCVRPLAWCDGHHIKHWADGGETSKDNGVPLCGHHHRLVHEGGWKLERGPGGDLVAVPP
jgi:hypothetical protein